MVGGGLTGRIKGGRAAAASSSSMRSCTAVMMRATRCTVSLARPEGRNPDVRLGDSDDDVRPAPALGVCARMVRTPNGDCECENALAADIEPTRCNTPCSQPLYS